MRYHTVRKKQTVHPAVPNSDTLVDASVTVYPIHTDQGSPNFLGEDHIIYSTTDILRNVIFSGYVTFYEITTFFVNTVCYLFIIGKMCFAAGLNGFAGRIWPRVVVWRTLI